MARTFGLWGTNFVALFVLAVLIKSPLIAVSTLIAVFGGHDLQTTSGLTQLTNLLTENLAVILEGAVTYYVIGQLVGSPPFVPAALGTGMACTPTMFAVLLLAGLAVLPGCMCLIVPGLIVATWLYVVVPVAVIEAPGPATALTRSKQLTAGNRWPVFACMAYLGLMRLAAFAVVVAGVRAAGGPAVFKAVTSSSDSAMQLTAGADAVVEFLNLPFSTLGAIGSAVVYQKLRAGSEGISVEEVPRILTSRFR